MKKKGLLLLLICTLFVFSVMLSACSLIKVNEERQANRVIATVSVDLAEKYGNGVKVLGDDWNYKVSMDITRRELVITVNYAINYYMQLYAAYGMTYSYDAETLLESSLKTLKTQKYNTICAMGELLAESKSTGRYDALYCLTEEYQKIYGKTLVPVGVLTIAERYDAVKTVNEQLNTQLEGYIDDSADEERDNEKSEANDKLNGYYGDGYFVSGVTIAKKNADGTFSDGLYATEVIDDGNEETADLDYTKVYAKVKMTKSGSEDVFVYTPIEEEDLTVAEDEEAGTTAKYMTAKQATISYSGRVYAEVTEDNEDGYEVEAFTSDAVKYTLVTPRTSPSADEEEETSLPESLRYVKTEVWNNENEYTDEMKELKTDIFNPNPETYADNEEKDAYRQLRSSLTSSNIGYISENPGKENVADYKNYIYYNGLAYYYESQFSTAVLSAKQYELGAEITETGVSRQEIEAEYELLVLKDKANYEYLSDEEQVTKFFNALKGSTSSDSSSSTAADGLASVYYVPIEALCSVSYEVDPTDKSYEPLFELDGDNNVISYNETYVTEEDGTYTMKYAYKNTTDGTYTINMIYVTHVLLSFDNVPGLADEYKNASADYTDEEKMVFIKLFAERIKTCPQLESFLAEYDAEKVYKVSDVFATDENGNLKYQTYEEAEEAINNILTEAFNTGSFEELLNAFIRLTEIYDDDGGKLTDSGYVVSAGDMENGWYEDFTATALNMYFNLLVKEYTPTGYEEADENELLTDRVQDAYSDYGVHKMFISFAPLYHVAIDEVSGIGLYTELNLEGSTRFDEIGESILETKRSKAYTDWIAKMTEEDVNEHSTTNEKYYDWIVKDIKG